MLSVKIKAALDKGLRVILKKAANGSNPTSYSLVKRYEWSKLRRTPFEAETPEEVYDFDTGKFTFEHLETNSRISFLKSVQARVEDDFDDDEDDREEAYGDEDDEEPKSKSNTANLESLIEMQAKTIRMLEDKVDRALNRTNTMPTVSVQKPRKARRTKVAV